jgi:putative phage-type endonuclease
MDADLIQGSPQWLQARCGSLGASQVHEALATTKSGWATSRANLIGRMVAERLTGIPAETYTNANMQWGNDQEPAARAEYAFAADVDVIEVGLIRHPRIEWTHVSPDGLIGEDGLLEIKAPLTSTHLDTILGDEPIAGKYITQIMWAMACTGRRYCDFVSYDPRCPDYARLFVKRIFRDDERIATLENDVREFLIEVDKKTERVRALGHV